MKPKPRPPPDGWGSAEERSCRGWGWEWPLRPHYSRDPACAPSPATSGFQLAAGVAVATGIAIKGQEEPGGRGDKGRDCLPPRAPQAKGAASVGCPSDPDQPSAILQGGGELKLQLQAPPRPLSPGANGEVGGSPADTVSSRGMHGHCLSGHEPRASGGTNSGPCSHRSSIPSSISHTHPAP